MTKPYILQDGKIIEVASGQEIPVPENMKKRAFLNFLNGGNAFNGWTPGFMLKEHKQYIDPIEEETENDLLQLRNNQE